MKSDSRTTILQVLPALDTGGVERGTVEMVQAITAAGGRALVASAGGRMVTQVERAGGEHIAMSLMTKDPLNIWLNAGRLTRLIRRQRVDLVHARSRAPAWSAWLAARRAKVPFVTTWHGVYSETLPGKRWYNGVMAKGERVIAISRYVASRVEHSYRVDPSRIRIIPRGVDPDAFDPPAVSGDRVHRLAQAWRVPVGARVVMLPARLTRWKGAETLLDALGILQAEGGVEGSLFCVLVGSDQGREEFASWLEAKAKQAGLGGRLRLAGHCEDMPAALLLADVVVNASLNPEPFGRVVIEAQAMGRPVVAFNHGGAAETIEDGQTGFLVPPGNTALLADGIRRALALSEEDRQALGWRARESILSGFTTAAMQRATLDVYSDVLS